MTLTAPAATDLMRRAAPSALAERVEAGPGFDVKLDGVSLAWQTVARHDTAVDRWGLKGKSSHGLEAAIDLHVDAGARCAVIQTTLTNTGSTAVGPLTEVSALYLSIGRMMTPPRVMSSTGGGAPMLYPPRAFRTRWDVMQFPSNDWEIKFSAETDQSSIKDLPLIMVCPDVQHDAPGFIVGLEWSAGWNMEVRYEPHRRALVTEAGPAVHDLVLEPDESLRLPAAHLVFFEGGFEPATNVSRRYIRQRIMPRYEGREVVPPVAYTIWPGIQYPYTDQDIYPQIETAADVGVEVFIVDDAWYEGRFPTGVGNWYADPAKFPDGLERVVEAVEAKGMRFGLFIDAEAEPGTRIIREHPDYFYGPELGSTNAPHRRLYNFCIPEACDYYIQMLGEIIERYHVRYLRWDYNMDGHRIFAEVDPTLKVKFAHLEGLYRVWDALRDNHPHLMLECCAGGGARLDLGTMKRHHACWCNDNNGHPHIYHAMQAGGNAFFPASYLGSSLGWPIHPRLTPQDRPDMVLHPDASLSDLAILSRMAGAFFLQGKIAQWPQEAKDRARHWIAVYKRVRHLLMQDYYRPLPQPQSEADWNAMQFTGSGGEGILFAFRWAGSTTTQCIPLRAIDRDASYRVTDEAGGEAETVSGDQLASGLPITLAPDSAKLFSYRVDGI